MASNSCWRQRNIALSLSLVFLLVHCAISSGADLRLATFRVDVTPPIGDGPCVGSMPKVASVEHPLELRGTLLLANDDVYVVAAIDFCGLCNSSDETLRDALAHAAGTTRDRVALQSLHQHSAPILDADAVRVLHGPDSPELERHLRFTRGIATRSAEAVSEARKRLRQVTKVVATKAQVDRVASNRRVPAADGSIGVRASLTRDAAVRDAPEGLVDPWLRTLTFLADDQPLVQWHFYATHPQTFYGDARISWDFVGMARDRLERQSGVFAIYFTGCGGNVTVGKYNDGTPDAREQLAERLHDALRRSASAAPDLTVDVAALPPNDVAWATTPLAFTVRNDGAFAPERLRRELAADQPFSTRLTAAMFAGFSQRLRDGHVPRAARLRIGGLDVAYLPGEPFVEFQLFAQRQAAKQTFVCVAGYGECGVWYYGPDRIYSDRGGFEQTWSLTGPCEKKVEAALTKLLAR